MFDWLKMDISDRATAEALFKNPLLNFTTLINESTGELINSKQTAEYENLKFIIYPSFRVEITGSLHKYFNGSIHNYNDFSYQDVSKTIMDIEEKFGLDPQKVVIRNIEFGVNINTSINPTTIIKKIVSYKGKPFNRMNTFKRPGFGIDISLTQYRIKIYNKSLQYQQPDNILRVEKKLFKMESLQNFQPVTLAKLLNYDLWFECHNILLSMYDDIIITEDIDVGQISKAERKIYEFGNNPRNWEALTKRRRYYYKNRFQAIIQKYRGRGYKDEVEELISKKGFQLLGI